MHDQTTALIEELYGAAFDRLVTRHGDTGETWSWLDLAGATLAELRRRRSPISHSVISEPLTLIVRDGFTPQTERDALFWKYGDVVLQRQLQLRGAFDDLIVQGLITRSFGETTSADLDELATSEPRPR